MLNFEINRENPKLSHCIIESSFGALKKTIDDSNLNDKRVKFTVNKIDKLLNKPCDEINNTCSNIKQHLLIIQALTTLCKNKNIKKFIDETLTYLNQIIPKNKLEIHKMLAFEITRENPKFSHCIIEASFDALRESINDSNLNDKCVQLTVNEIDKLLNKPCDEINNTCSSIKQHLLRIQTITHIYNNENIKKFTDETLMYLNQIIPKNKLRI